jgi:hypothetical protein
MEWKASLQLAQKFFLYQGKLYRKEEESQHKLVVPKDQQMFMLKAAHDALGHRGAYTTTELIGLRFWWPAYEQDVKWYVKTCDVGQKCQEKVLKIPPVVTHTPSIFQVLYADTVEMTPASNSVSISYMVDVGYAVDQKHEQFGEIQGRVLLDGYLKTLSLDGVAYIPSSQIMLLNTRVLLHG